MKAVIIIPARYASTRLPGKALANLCGKPLIQHVYERANGAHRAGRVLVATDDERIASAVEGFGGDVAMTRADHQSGTERIAEAAAGLDADIIVNLQGDEPEIDPAHLDALIALQADHGYFATTLACPFPADAAIDDPSAVKVVAGKKIEGDAFEALYFSRAPVPFRSDGVNDSHTLHIGVYAFSQTSLQKFARTPVGALEKSERLEQLRILEMGERIAARMVSGASPGVDTPEDLAAARARLLKK
ncbi:MAG: 3-deoxy-manno-octulosonate cytidylyltransferase [Pseudomonadota bacterium]